jgi:hypothetical protein
VAKPQAIIFRLAALFPGRSGFRTMTEEQLAAMRRLLAEVHRRLAKEAMLEVVQQYHSDLAQRLSDEAALIPRRTAIVERLHEREQKRTIASERKPTIGRLESQDGETLGGRQETGASLVAALEKAGIEFIAENGGGAGVRLAKRARRSK